MWVHDADLELAMRLASAAHGPAAPTPAATALLETLSEHVRVLAAAVTAFDPVTGTHTVLASTGYRPEVLDYLRSPAFLCDDVGYQLLVRRPGRRARCWRDVDSDYEASPSVVRVFRPAGFAGGASARFTTGDGRYTGDLHLNSDDPGEPSPTVVATLHHVVPLLAAATDVTRRLTTVLAELGPEVQAAAVTGSAELVPLPGRTPPPLLRERPGIATGVVRWRAGRTCPQQAVYHCTSGSDWYRVQLVAVAGGTLVAVTPSAPPHGLSLRELQVLTLLSEGLANVSLARRLGISERTVAHHVEHVLEKLGVPSRTAATRLAVEDGLRLPPGG
jgi:DNA-binding CsgD family transcriptional regulator